MIFSSSLTNEMEPNQNQNQKFIIFDFFKLSGKRKLLSHES